MGNVGKLMRALGLMSGTSMDGIDVALIDTDGMDAVERGPSITVRYNDEQRAALGEAVRHARGIVRREERPGNLAHVERLVTELNAAAVHAFCRKKGIDRGTIDVIGFHGQTVLHRPAQRLTVQLGDGPLLVELATRPVVYDLRAADVAAGGQGAPLVPIYHQALANRIDVRPVAVVNIGGVANVTWIGRDGRLIAFDTGPGNAMIDDLVQRRLGLSHDAGGALAAKGTVHDDYVKEYLRHSFFSARPPKSLDRNAFAGEMVDALSTEDAAATLTAFSAEAIAKAREHLPDEPRMWVVAGGGRMNKTLMSMIAGRVENAVVPAEAVGLDGDAVEAEAWAYLAVRSLKGLPITFPGTTGAPKPMTGGKFAGELGDLA
ncbi:MAG: anhydro-N-acetylmuramic acid kinase [Hyphomicrobium sp.]